MLSPKIRALAVGGAAMGLWVTGAATGAQPAAAAPSGCEWGVVICIDQDARTLRLMIDGTSRLRMSVRFGSERTPTHEGVFRIEWKDAGHVSTLYHTSMPFSLFFDGGQAIHVVAAKPRERMKLLARIALLPITKTSFSRRERGHARTAA